MKIEMGESLFYSWLRHVKECPIVQSNWKSSPSWELRNTDSVERFMLNADEHFKKLYGYEIFGNNKLSQLIQQAEIDVLGIHFADDENSVYAIDVAYHEAGLNYGDKEKTTISVIKKLLRTAMCVNGYFGMARAEIIFASPKINPANMEAINPAIAEINTLFADIQWRYTARLLANDDFNELVLKPIVIASNNVSDTSELFLRGYQLVKMFAEPQTRSTSLIEQNISEKREDALGELKIGKIAQTVLRDALESGKVSEAEVEQMQTKEYSKQVFGIDFPLLISTDCERNEIRYYASPLKINGKPYYLCSQWFEVAANNDRPFLMKWLNDKGALNSEGEVL